MPKLKTVGKPPVRMNGRDLENQNVKGFNPNKWWLLGGLVVAAFWIYKTDKI